MTATEADSTNWQKSLGTATARLQGMALGQNLNSITGVTDEGASDSGMLKPLDVQSMARAGRTFRKHNKANNSMNMGRPPINTRSSRGRPMTAT